MTAPGRAPDRGRILRALGDHLLTVLAVAGTLCIVLVILSWFFNVSIIMFRTGSMSPTITSGSISLVQEIPASEMEEGDVLTVDRGERVLPVTHRVVAISEVDDSTGEVTFTMRGDANDVDDPEPYTATEVRRVLFSIPGAARVIQWFGNPYVLGGITVGATVLVIWAFWPRERTPDGAADDDEDSTDQPPRESTTFHAVGIPLLAALVFTAPGIDRAETTLIAGEHLRMQTVGDPVQMQNLAPGRPVIWEVGIWAEAPDPGEILLGITGRGELAQIDGALVVTVDGCSERWSGDSCPSGAVELLGAESLDRIAQGESALPLTTMPSDEQRWLRVEVVLDATQGLTGVDGGVLIHASGAGEEISAGPDDPPRAGDPPGDGDILGADDSPEAGDAPGTGTGTGSGIGSGSGSSGGGGDGLARTGATGVMALLGSGLLAAALGIALRRPQNRRTAR